MPSFIDVRQEARAGPRRYRAWRAPHCAPGGRILPLANAPKPGLTIRTHKPLSVLDHPRKPDAVIAGEITVKNRADGAHQHLAALGYGDAIA